MRTAGVSFSKGGDREWLSGGGGAIAAVFPDEASSPLGSVAARVWPCSSRVWSAWALPIGFCELFRNGGATVLMIERRLLSAQRVANRRRVLPDALSGSSGTVRSTWSARVLFTCLSLGMPDLSSGGPEAMGG
jgi:hypothetical protein